MRVSVIVPVLNEHDGIGPLIEALFTQTRPPDEVVVADGGSTDGTLEVLGQLAGLHPRLVVVNGPGGIAENRNAAIRIATGPIIACTDAGCVPERGWLQALIAPFEDGADWVAGFYRPDGRSVASTSAGVVMMTVLEDVDMDHFLPGGSSQAFLKSAWERVGGFPEGLTAGEDTLYGEQLKAAGYRPVFAPDAVVSWHPPATLAEMTEKARRWGEADGVNRVRTGAYLRVILAYWLLPLVALALAMWRPWVGLALLLVFIVVVIYRVRHKFRWVPGPGRWFLVPLAHVRQQLAQSFGWLEGFGFRNLLRKLADRGFRRARRWLPRSITQGLEERRSVRHNVDVVVTDTQRVKHWLENLPNTYRVSQAMGRGEGAVVQASVELRAGAEPLVAPVSVSLPEHIAREIDAEPAPLADPVALFSLLRQTGHSYRLLPSAGGRTIRSDPIESRGSWVVLAAVPLHDVGGGSRGAQIAQEAASRGFHVTYLSRFDASESVDLGLRFTHPRLEEGTAEDFDLPTYLNRVRDEVRVALVEFPHRDYGAIIDGLAGAGFRVVYDLIDDWTDHTLGGWWYEQGFADWLIARAQLLTASAPSLVESLRNRSGREVIEVPNGVNTRVFGSVTDLPMPPDLPPGKGPVIEYHGSLYGDWFDWDAVARVGTALADARVLLIGDRPRHPPALPANVHLLGLKPQGDLPGYLARTDVGMVPFKVSPTTHAVSPLKVFEYLAMGVPVAAPPLEPILGLEGVHADPDLVAAVRRAMQAPRPDRAKAAAEHGWGERLGRILQALEVELPPLERPVRIERRPVRHYREEERLLP